MKEKKRSFHMPTAYSILLALILIVAAVTWLVGGSVQRVSLAQVVMAVPRGFLDAIDVCLFILILGGFLGVVTATGALDRGIGALVRHLRGHEMVLIPILMVLFSLGGTTYGMAEETMAFYALITATMVAAGFDAMVGAAGVLGGAGVGVLGSTVNPFAISAAVDAYQSAYPGVTVDYGRILLLGAVLWLTSLAAGIWLVMRYAAQVRKSGRSILTASEQRQVRESYGQVERVTEEEADLRLSGRQKAALALFAVAFLVMVVALIPWEDFEVNWFAGTAWLTGEPLG
ncbi:MAG: YfcC family protein, partial [Lachnospiraceae bacterium]|nr:YfcC family protein [Lachnospiraceae bacterium]